MFGAYNIGPEAAKVAYYGLLALQHRGQESSGIVSTRDGMFYSHSAPGLVAEVYREEDLGELPVAIASWAIIAIRRRALLMMLTFSRYSTEIAALLLSIMATYQIRKSWRRFSTLEISPPEP